MSIKLKELLDTKSKPKLIAEGLFSKLKSLFKLDNKKINTLKKDKKFMSHVNNINSSYKRLSKQIEKDYGIKINYQKMKASDFL
jgi:hypothetical protein|tara:strand:+ start:11231 stop:11482 length:252 start_codon:yes stop_codon:yes gene_type:complete